MTETLHTTHHGDTAGIPLIIAPGLYGSARNWNVIAKRLSEFRPVIAVDMRNHGDSFHADTHSYADMAGDLAEVIIANGGRADVLGHSMGGKAAMALALSRPDLIRKLIVADIAPVTYAHEHSDKIAAMQAVDLSRVSRRRDAEDQLRNAIPDAQLRAFLLQSLALEGAAHWKLNLATLGAEMPEIMSFPTFNTQFFGPALFLRGGNSAYLLAEHEPAIDTLFPNAQIETIPDAGHWLHAEQPRAFTDALTKFLDIPTP
ncbi:MAG: alpha/beta fold hydrolase [Paracoccaceae bacterium]